MSEPTTTDEDDNDADNDGRRKAIRTAAVVILLALICVTVVAAQAGTVSESDDFEDGNIDGWSGPSDSISTTSIEGDYSLQQADGYAPGSGNATPVQWDEGPELALDEEFTVRGTSYSEQGQENAHTRVGLINDNDEGAILIFSAEYDRTLLADDGLDYDPETAPSMPQYYDDTWVSWEIYSPGDGTVHAKVWEVGGSEPTDYQLSREFDEVSSQIGISAGYADGGRHILLDSVSVEGTLAAGDADLNIDTPNLIQHGNTRTYDVEELRPRPGGTNSSVDVTENATVTSSNPDVLSVDSENETLTATGNTSVAEVVQVEATYNGLTAYKEVTVAESTVENLEILPGIWRFNALVGDTTIQVILLGTLVGVVGARGASSFAGLSLMEMSMVMGFLGGWVGLGMVLASTFVAVFIGLNLAANIDYSVRR